MLKRLSIREYETAEERRTPLWKRLYDHIFAQFLQIDDYQELILTYDYLNQNYGRVFGHASTFIRVRCGPDKLPFILHLDCDKPLPECNDPDLFHL